MNIKEERLYQIKDYFLLRTHDEFAQFLDTSLVRIRYLFRKDTKKKRLKDEEVQILTKKYFIKEEWLKYGTGKIVDEENKKNHELLNIFNELTFEQKEAFIYEMKIVISKNKKQNMN